MGLRTQEVKIWTNFKEKKENRLMRNRARKKVVKVGHQEGETKESIILKNWKKKKKKRARGGEYNMRALADEGCGEHWGIQTKTEKKKADR